MKINLPGRCFICNGKIAFYMHGYDFLYKTTKEQFSIFKCSKCGCEFIFPLPKPNKIKSFYPKNYYSYNTKKQITKNFFLNLREKILAVHYDKETQKDIYYFLAKMFKSSLHGIPMEPIGKKRFLDIGCGDGYNLDLLKKYGWIVTGFEIGRKGKKGDIYYADNFLQIKLNKKFDFIRLWHVLEHIPEPETFLKRVYNLLDRNGILEIGVPNSESLYAKLFGKYWYNRDIPRHLINYNPKNLEFLLRRHGFKIIKVDYISAGGFLGSLQHIINSNFNSNINFITNTLMMILFFPLDLMVNYFRIGDIISLKATK